MPRKSRLPFSLDPLDPKFVPAKPKHNIEGSRVLDLEKKGNLIITRKRDGYRHLATVTKSGVKIYTRGIEDVTASFGHICVELAAMFIGETDILLDGELIVDRSGADDFQSLVKIAKSKPDAAIKLQQTSVAKATYMIFDIIVRNGEVLSLKPYRDRLDAIRAVFTNIPKELQPQHVVPVTTLECSFKEATKLVRKEDWEGLVLYDATKTTAFRLDGKKERPVRPDGCWKWKPLFEDDFIAKNFAYGSGKNKHRMGKLFLLQIDPGTGEEISCGEVGGGFTDEDREHFAKATYPLVVQVEFQKRFPSGALRHPQFMRLRTDKSPAECLLPKNFQKKSKSR